MGAYAKAITAVVGAVAIYGASVWTDDVITLAEWVQVAVAGFTAFQVWLTANVGLPLWDKAKAITAGALAALGGLAGYLAAGEHMTNSMWLNVAIAGLTAAGVFTVANSPSLAHSTH